MKHFVSVKTAYFQPVNHEMSFCKGGGGGVLVYIQELPILKKQLGKILLIVIAFIEKEENVPGFCF